jgi:hypothetical protein
MTCIGFHEGLRWQLVLTVRFHDHRGVMVSYGFVCIRLAELSHLAARGSLTVMPTRVSVIIIIQVVI